MELIADQHGSSGALLTDFEALLGQIAVADQKASSVARQVSVVLG
jgi:hypothetical protein